MKGIGTIINVILILLGGSFGLLFKNKLNETIKNNLLSITGIVVIFMGIDVGVEKMDQLPNALIILIISLVLGYLVGEYLDIDGRIERFGDFLKSKTNQQKDASFTSAFVNATCVVCIGAMAVIGSFNDGIYNDPSVLIMKSLLDFIIIAMMSATSGIGCMFSFIPVGLFQGSFTLLAMMLGEFMSASSLDALSLVGSVLIFIVGLNLIREKKIKVANLLPALIVAVLLCL